LAAVTGTYALFLLAMLAATAVYSKPHELIEALAAREIRHSIALSLVTCTVTALLSVALAVPAGYFLLGRIFRGRTGSTRFSTSRSCSRRW